jgi:hypothetical protein
MIQSTLTNNCCHRHSEWRALARSEESTQAKALPSALSRVPSGSGTVGMWAGLDASLRHKCLRSA